MSEIRDLTIHIENVVSAEALTAFHLEIARLPYRPNTVGFLYAREG